MTYRLNPNSDYQLGLLHFIHLLTAQFEAGEALAEVFEHIRSEEGIPEELHRDFLEYAHGKSDGKIFEEGLRMLHNCSEEEKISAILQLLRLAHADMRIEKKEVKMLFHSLQVKQDFEEVLSKVGPFSR